ncbi:DUF2577 domain-containing protein [Paenibacillus sp. YYML68]|uniref:DUF2577 domain-containing protein n=1 Tax=Paenibacillus sp. YYML68 TaxID=2909250 RepID=UPI00249357A7|nr:DUF2577 domain-containing protein [Paenibacillus sp. YYML68]
MLLDVIKQASKAGVEAGNPVALVLGTVTNEKPLEITVDQRFTLTEEFLLVLEHLTPYEVELQHTHTYVDQTGNGSTSSTTAEALKEKLVIRRGMKLGDQVLLLRAQGGQPYVVIDRVVTSG